MSLETDTGINTAQSCGYTIRMSVNAKTDVTKTGVADGRWVYMAQDHVEQSSLNIKSVYCMSVHSKSYFKWSPTRHIRRMQPLSLGMLCSYSAEIFCQFTRVAAVQLSVYQLATEPADTANRDAFLSMLPVTRSPSPSFLERLPSGTAFRCLP
jgi:hypothetical protein